MIELRDLSHAFGAHRAVEGLNLRVETGEFLVLAGLSGSGKTTTLSMINRLVEPTRGSVLIDGVDVRERDPVALRREIGFVFQDIGLFPHMSVAENVGIVPKLLGARARNAEYPSTDELLALVRLDPARVRASFPPLLSGGERQRVGVARALAARPHIMLMDEPFGAVDAPTRDELSADYRRIHERLGLTTVMVTHDMAEAMLLADRIALMRAGTLVQAGTPGELLAAPADDFVRSMIEAPRRRARALAALEARSA
jgi:osmoprotectant transport system ATP-binding protein